ncbi:MepB family protein [Rhodoferax aquaticus]|uniref:MepB domain containing protein n=1 Tax=Rhodoferax aquaticus TaxID=2527691 RepID=A0A515EJX9_9BURK|nr:MepB family protein [Rhodoferax aquaticus]QDL52968.1 MepB domain containing protein [Rhodoferax aquaticus]
MHPELHATLNFLAHTLGAVSHGAAPEPESAEYAAHHLQINARSVRFRFAKITPTKGGQFVTLWKRSAVNPQAPAAHTPIAPFDASDAVDVVVVSARAGALWGLFVFPKAVLVAQGVFARAGVGGKRALRVYPAWDACPSRQAQKTQDWQLRHFIDLSKGMASAAEQTQTVFAMAFAPHHAPNQDPTGR